MDSSRQSGPSHLFLLRLWTQNASEQGGEWWARVQEVFTGEACTFRVSPAMTEMLLALLTSPSPARQADKAGEEEDISSGA
jgi:hypothetical protein